MERKLEFVKQVKEKIHLRQCCFITAKADILFDKPHESALDQHVLDSVVGVDTVFIHT